MPRDLFPETGRHTVPYKAAVWCGRLVVLWVLTWLILLPILAVTQHSRSRDAPFDRVDLVVVLLAAAGVVLVFLTFVLLLAAGVEIMFSFKQGSTPWFADRRVGRQFFRDLFWLPPR